MIERICQSRVTFGPLPTAQNDKFGSRPVAKLALPQKISEPTVQGIKQITSALPAKNLDSNMSFTFPTPAGETTFLGAGTPFWVGLPTFDEKVGAGGRKRNLPDIRGVL